MIGASIEILLLEREFGGFIPSIDARTTRLLPLDANWTGIGPCLGRFRHISPKRALSEPSLSDANASAPE
jgi:hypothetical protein